MVLGAQDFYLPQVSLVRNAAAPLAVPSAAASVSGSHKPNWTVNAHRFMAVARALSVRHK
ncbi:hypothetical protein OESDEN_10001 [Oesophagostomum dentatum]|uniref:Uncharacterized protein n=1 Tax=Oesophagostomum dentatum TaxID=61180 RepID=A0A0B1SYY4_OESDE|nr:hypothetical protein OESDEN_10001 [Oesophagostomum dentatum]